VSRKLFVLCALLLACNREKRPLVVTASDAHRPLPLRVVIKNPYEGNAYAISQGQQLFATTCTLSFMCLVAAYWLNRDGGLT